jgi:UDP-N-acetylglucosamine 1-carboxyvinyltransferase
MSEFHMTGGRALEGELTVQGAKNSVLPILAASLLAGGQVVLHNCPKLTDVSVALDILRHLGCTVQWDGADMVLDPAGAEGVQIPEDLMGKMRSSIIFLGPVLARHGEVRLTYPGGCELGPRPIDLHLAAMEALGAQVEESPEGLRCWGKLTGRELYLSIPSVGATENIMLAAMGASGTTTIVNAAREPEIGALQEFLNQIGGRVRGAGSSVVSVEGNLSLHGGEHTVMGDRIVAITLMSATAAAGGEVSLSGVDWRQVSSVSAVLAEAGCRVVSQEDRVTISRDCQQPLRGVPTIRTAPYPGFPTDGQAPVMAALCAGTGCTLFVENVFDSRFRHVEELRRMGANITTEGRVALVRGVSRLHGAHVQARDLRGGGGLTVAALGAEGETVLSGVRHIDRGYERLEEQVRQLGGQMTRVDERKEGGAGGKTAET